MDRTSTTILAWIGLCFLVVAIPVTLTVFVHKISLWLHPRITVKAVGEPGSLPSAVRRPEDVALSLNEISARLRRAVDSVDHNYSQGTWTTSITATPPLTLEEIRELSRTEFSDLVAAARLDPDFSMFDHQFPLTLARLPAFDSLPERRQMFEDAVRSLERDGSLRPAPAPVKEPVAPVRTTWQRLKDED